MRGAEGVIRSCFFRSPWAVGRGARRWLRPRHGGIGGGLMGMNRPTGTPPDVAELGGNFSLVAQGLGAYSDRVQQPRDLIPAYRHTMQAIENGRAALVKVMIKPMRTPEPPDDWSL